MKKITWFEILRKIHRDEAGAVSLETILIIGAIALPILIFMINVAWPRIKNIFNNNINNLETESDAAKT
jgi:Flp pilus assembly pilin Flp